MKVIYSIRANYIEEGVRTFIRTPSFYILVCNKWTC